jgi:hypothetical protein
MLYAFGIEVAHVAEAEVTVTQVIGIPAARKMFQRTISATHPRRQWAETPYRNGSTMFTNRRIGRDFQRHEHYSQLDFKPLIKNYSLLEITDDEYLALAADGNLPRNVALRYQRMLESRGGNVIGKNARTLEAAVDAMDSIISRGDAWGGRPGESFRGRLKHSIIAIEEAVATGNVTMLAMHTPQAAQCRGGGVHRNADNLPKPGEAATPGPPAPAPAPAVAAPAARNGEVKVGQAITRANGEDYIARAVEIGVKGKSDVGMYVDVLSGGGSILLEGRPGTGKTAGLEAAAKAMGRNLITLVVSPNTEAEDLLGNYVAVVGEDGREVLVWEDGPLVKAMETGSIILIDEIFLAPGSELSPLFPLMDGRRIIERIAMNPARGRIEAKEGFAIVAAFNPDSARHINDALLSRFDLRAEVGTDWNLARGQGHSERMVAMAEHLNALADRGDLGWAPQYRESARFAKDEAKMGTVYALRNLLRQVPEEEMEIVIALAQERWGDLANVRRVVKPMKV